MIHFWNIVHYFVYKAVYQLHLLFNKINPVLYFYRIPVVKRHFEKKEINPMIEINKAWENPDFGLSIIWAGGFMYVLFFLICFGIINLISGMIKLEFNLKFYHFIILFIISILVNYFLLFKKNIYRRYFREFDKMQKAEKKKWAWVSFTVILGILIFSIGSFVYMAYRL
jgi:hypothetical protein